jgi:hypothetical protein
MKRRGIEKSRLLPEALIKWLGLRYSSHLRVFVSRRRALALVQRAVPSEQRAMSSEQRAVQDSLVLRLCQPGLGLVRDFVLGVAR